jgi:hypothetical protein
MRLRFLTSLGALAVVTAAVSLLTVSAAGQTPGAAAKTARTTKTTPTSKTWTTPRTPWGDPDLQGIYNNATSTPLQRPSKLGEKDVLSDQEAEALQEELTESIDAAPRPDYPTGNYNDFWFDPRRREVRDKRTSLIAIRRTGGFRPWCRCRRSGRRQGRRVRGEPPLPRRSPAPGRKRTTLSVASRAPTGHYLPFGYNSNFRFYRVPATWPLRPR